MFVDVAVEVVDVAVEVVVVQYIFVVIVVTVVKVKITFSWFQGEIDIHPAVHSKYRRHSKVEKFSYL